MLEECLEACGLNPSERRVLAFLLENGPSTAGRLAKLTKIKRASVYSAVDTLSDLGVVVSSKERGTAVFASVEPQTLAKAIEERASRRLHYIQLAAERLGKLMKQLPGNQMRSMNGFDISTIQSSESVLLTVEETLLRGEFVAFFDPQLIPKKQLEGAVTRFLAQTARTKPRIREIMVDGPTAKWYRSRIKNVNHECRLVPAGTEMPSDIILSDNSVVITRYDLRQELGIKIREPSFYRTLRTLFELLWKVSI